MPETRFAVGDRVTCRWDGDTGRIYRVFTGTAVDYCTPLYEVIWGHEPGAPALGSRHYADELKDA